MFKIESNVLKEVVSSLAKGARKAKLGESFLFIRSSDDEISFYFNGNETSVEKRIKAEVQAAVDVATTVKEIEPKVNALPNDTEILVQLEGNILRMKWGKKSSIKVSTVPETTPMIEIPEIVSTVKWPAGSVHGLSRVMTPFAANPNSSHVKHNPSVAGPNFTKDPDTGEIFVRASDGFRAVTMRADKLGWFDKSVSIESSTLLSVADVLPREAEITVGANESLSLIVFRTGSTTAVVRTLNGEFPPVDKMYRDKAKSKWTFDRLDLIELCKRVKILSPQRPILEFRVKDQKVIALVPDVLEQHVGVVIEGDPSNFAVNATYLEMAASLFRKDEVDLLVEAGNKAITVRIDENDMIRSLLSPVQLR